MAEEKKKQVDIYNLKNGFIPIDRYFAEMKAKEKEAGSGPAENTKSIDSLVGEERGEKGDGNQEATDNRMILNEIINEKIRFLKDILSEIEDQISDREKLKTILTSKFDEGICGIQSKLYELESWDHGSSSGIDARRLKLETELEDLKLQQSQEIRESWRDVALLRKEHRKFFQEYRNAVRRVKIVLPGKGGPDNGDFVDGASIESRWNRR